MSNKFTIFHFSQLKIHLIPEISFYQEGNPIRTTGRTEISRLQTEAFQSNPPILGRVPRELRSSSDNILIVTQPSTHTMTPLVWTRDLAEYGHLPKRMKNGRSLAESFLFTNQGNQATAIPGQVPSLTFKPERVTTSYSFPSEHCVLKAHSLQKYG